MFAELARPGDYRMIELVEAARGRLDAIFGPGAYQLASDRDEAAEVRSGNLRFSVCRDLNFLLLADIEIYGLGSDDAAADPDLWLKFLDPGAEAPSAEFDRHGWCTTSPEIMLGWELDKLERLTRELFASAESTRDAQHFIDGYNRAYADHAAWKC